MPYCLSATFYWNYPIDSDDLTAFYFFLVQWRSGILGWFRRRSMDLMSNGCLMLDGSVGPHTACRLNHGKIICGLSRHPCLPMFWLTMHIHFDLRHEASEKRKGVRPNSRMMNEHDGRFPLSTLSFLFSMLLYRDCYICGFTYSTCHLRLSLEGVKTQWYRLYPSFKRDLLLFPATLGMRRKY